MDSTESALKSMPRFHLHFTPTGASWLNSGSTLNSSVHHPLNLGVMSMVIAGLLLPFVPLLPIQVERFGILTSTLDSRLTRHGMTGPVCPGSRRKPRGANILMATASQKLL
jgi:hypothetical protein